MVEMKLQAREQYLLKKVRVQSYPNDWTLKTVGKACSIQNNFRKPISVEERQKIQGEYPYYGPTGILSYINEYGIEGPFALIGEDGDHFLKYNQKDQTQFISGKNNVNNHAHIIKSTNICFASWFAFFFQHRNIVAFLTRQGAGRYKLNKETLSKLPILIPPLAEQKAIADLLSVWDTAIEKMERLIQMKEKRFEGLGYELISVPPYPKGHVRDFVSEVSKRNKTNEVDLVLSVTNHSGFVLPEDQFQRRVASANVTNYKIIEAGQYAYNPSRINVGSIARLDNWEKGILSPMYVVFRLDKEMVVSDFFKHWLGSHEAKSRIKRSAQGTVRESVSFGDLGAIPFPTPSKAEQSQVVKVLNAAQAEIDLLKHIAKQYKEQKRGLMQKILVGEWRVKH